MKTIAQFLSQLNMSERLKNNNFNGNVDGDYRPYSPLKPLHKFLVLAKFVGFPWKVCTIDGNESCTTKTIFTFCPYSYIGLGITALITGGGMGMLLLAMTALGASPFFMINELINKGMSATESCFITISFAPSAYSFIFYYYLLRKTKKGLNDFCSEYCHLQQSLKISTKKLKQLFSNLCLYRLLGCIFATLSGISFAIAWMPMQPDHMDDSPWKTIVYCCFVINLCTIINPLEIVVDMLILHCFRALYLAFEGYKLTWTVGKVKHVILDEASRLIKLLNILNTFSGSLLFLGFSVCIYTLVFNIFYGFLTLTTFNGSIPLVFHVGLANVGWGIYNTLKFIAFIKIGWQLSKQIRWLKKKILLYQIDNSSSITEKDKSIIGLIIDNCSKSSAIQPMEIFDLSISTGIGIAAWLITNLIVLLQFRGIESTQPTYNETVIHYLDENSTIRDPY